MATEATNSISDDEESEPVKTSPTSSECESESEPEPVKTSKLIPTSSESESESESDSESEPEAIKTSKIVPTSSSSSSSESEPEAASKVVATSKIVATVENDASKPPTGKRALSELDEGHAKRIKKGIVLALSAPATETGGGEKIKLFQRLWSEENEIELIQGMLDYVEQKSKDPLLDVNNFYEFVRESVHVGVTITQMLTKCRRLKKKFENNLAIVEANVKVRSFSNPHEKKMFHLSANLWGTATTKKVNVKRKTVGFEAVNLPTGDEIMSMGLEKLSEADKAEVEKKWKDIKVQELKLYINKVEVLKRQAELVLNAINGTN